MEQKSSHKGILGVVSDLIQVEKKYETAIETALGGSIQNIVTEDEATAKEMIAYLKQNRYGRATFLPLTSVKAQRAIRKTRMQSENRVSLVLPMNWFSATQNTKKSQLTFWEEYSW